MYQDHVNELVDIIESYKEVIKITLIAKDEILLFWYDDKSADHWKCFPTAISMLEFVEENFSRVD